VSGWLLTIITFLLVLNLVTRFFGVDVEGLLEMTTFVFLAVIYLGLAYSEENDEHIKVNYFLSRAPKNLKFILNIFNYLLAAGIGGILTYAAAETTLDAYVSKESVPGTTPLPTYPVKIIIFIGITFFFLQTTVHLYNTIRKGKR
jgi:TRAP-type C4-dicarboxylate transport system permease small subunit